MIKIRFATLLAAVVTMCCLAGCQKNDSADLQESTDLQGTDTETAIAEAESFKKEFEITNWTMEDLVSKIEVEGQKIIFPCTVSQLDGDFVIENVGYSSKYDHTVADLYYKKKYISQITVNKNVDEEYFKDNNIIAFFMGGSESLPQFNIMGISNNSTVNDVISILGNPNVGNSDANRPYRYYFNDDNFVLIDFDDNDKMWLFFILYNKEN